MKSVGQSTISKGIDILSNSLKGVISIRTSKYAFKMNYARLDDTNMFESVAPNNVLITCQIIKRMPLVPAL
jgi:hypothetical protein